MIDSGGVKVYPRDVEEIAARHPAIREVAVFGVPDGKWGETPIAAVVLVEPGAATAGELRDWINARVQARYQRVSQVVIHQEFPRSPAGKTLKRELRKPLLGDAKGLMLTGKWFEETKVGDTFGATLTVTETHLVLAAGLLGDFNPLHVDEVFARGTRMGGRILHGTFTSAIVSAPAGMYFHGTAIAYLEHNCRFKAPVRAGDTLRTTWTIEERIAKPKQKGGVVTMRARCENQRGEVVAEADGKMLVANRP